MADFKTDKWVYVEPFGVIYDENTKKVIANVHGAGTGSCFCFTPEGQANARLIAAAPELYKLVLEELIPISDYGGILSFERERKVKKLLDSIDGKTNNNGNKKKLLQCPFCGNTNLTKLDRKGCYNEGFFCPVCEMSFVIDDMNEGETK